MSLLRDQMGEAGMKWGVCQNKNVSMEPEGKNYRMLSCKLDDNVEFIHDDYDQFLPCFIILFSCVFTANGRQIRICRICMILQLLHALFVSNHRKLSDLLHNDLVCFFRKILLPPVN